MKSLFNSANLQSNAWTLVFALMAGSFITGMTGYITMGLNYPIVLIIAVVINYILARFIKSLSAKDDFSIYQRLMHLFRGNLGHFFSSFAGMFVLLVLLFVTIGESKTAAIALQQVSGLEISLEYFIVFICLLAGLPSLLGLKQNLAAVFFLFAGLILLRSKFILFSLWNNSEIPAWTFSNMYNSIQLGDFEGSDGIVFIAFRLAFWSLIAVEIFNLWKNSGSFSQPKLRALIAVGGVMTLMVIPGIYMAGVFPAELWQLIVLSEEGCFGACPSLALGYNFGGQAGLYLMASSAILSRILLVSISFMLISSVLKHLSTGSLFFGRLEKNHGRQLGRGNNEYVLFAALALVILLSMLNLSASYWVGLSLYLSFGLILLIQVICLFNIRYKWFHSRLLGGNSLLALSILSVLMMGILFYSGFRGEHVYFINTAFAIFCFSLWVAASSLVYMLRINQDR